MNTADCDEMISDKYDGVVLWDVPATRRNKMLKYLYARNVRVYMMPKISDAVARWISSP